jgi:uncharacterized protein (TIGR03437 family)
MNCPRPLVFAALLALAVLGCSDTAAAQPVLTVAPATTPSNPLVFSNIPSGGISPAQTVTIGTTGATMATLIIQVNPSSPWIAISPGASVNIPATISVQCNTATLMQGNYNGSFTMTVAGSSPPDQVTVYVSLSVSGTSQLSATPPTLGFTAQDGATTASPNGIPVEILSSGVPLNYTLQAQTNDGGNWLLLSTTTGSSGGASFTVSVNPAGLYASAFPAVFNGLITANSTTTLDSVQIPVQVTLNATAQLTITPTSLLPFLYQAGTSTDPPPQQLSITSAGGSLAFAVQESPAVSWLVLSALGGTAGTTPDPITLNATPVEQGLTPGTYSTSVIVTPSGEPALPAVPVSLVVAAHPLLQLSANNLTFTSSFGGTPPPAQSVIITGSGGAAVGFTVSTSASWLVANAVSTTTPTTLTVQVNLTSLSIQNYTGTVTITPTNGDAYAQTIAVALNVSAASQLVAGPPSLLFSYEIGQLAPMAQTVDITSTGQPLTFLVTTATSNCGSTWLAAEPSGVVTNSTVSVGVVTANLTSGTACSGTVILSYFNGLANATLSIPVTLAVSGTAELSVNTAPGFGAPTVALGSSPFQQQIALTSTDPLTQVSYTASVINVAGGAWLGISGSTNGTTPQNLFIQYNPGILTIPGTYTATVQITSPSLGGVTLTLPVTLTVTSTITVTTAPTSLTFSEAQGGSLPAAQSINLSSNPGVATYTAVVASTTGGNWLQISPTSGNTNGPVTVSILPNTLSPGSYPAQISFAFQGAATASATVNVVLNVTKAETITASPTSLSFGYQLGGTAPPGQQLSITSSGNPVAISVSANSSGWLSVSNASGSTPQTINVSVNPAGLVPQTYSGSISISAPGVLTSPLTVTVLFVVSAPPVPQPFVIRNNATNTAGAIAPGEEIAITGIALGPASPAAGTLYSVNSSGGVSPTLAGVQVTFDNNPGTPIFVSADQIDVIVPYEINGRLSTNMVVSYNGVASSPIPLSVATASPGLFSDNFTGTGQVAALNQNYTVNGLGSGMSAAPLSSVISLYGTGGGQSSPVSVTGSVTPIPNSASGLLNFANVTATIGGVPATVEFAGEAPGLVTGVFQINVLIPANVTPGNSVPVVVSIGGISSPLGTTIAVQ